MDKYVAIREFFKEANVQNAKMRGTSSFLSVDKTLYSYQGRIGIKQYNPAKPVKYGLLYWSFCDAELPNIHFTLPYNPSKHINVESTLINFISTLIFS